MECMTYGCSNKNTEGHGYQFVLKNKIVFLCLPCMDYISKKEGKHNQILRNAKDDLEICVCAAILATDGTVVRGQRHADAIHTCIEKGKEPDIHNGQGFVTSTGRFVDRFEGYRLQIKAGVVSVAQGGYRGQRLFSEDLY